MLKFSSSTLLCIILWFDKRVYQFGPRDMNVRKCSQLKFSMKFLLEGNVLLVEHPGREAQLFMPVLHGNGITMQSIIFDDQARLLNRNSICSTEKVHKTSSKIIMSVNSKGGSVKMNEPASKSSPKGGVSNIIPIEKASFQWVRNGALDQKRNSGGKSLPFPSLKIGSSSKPTQKTHQIIKNSINSILNLKDVPKKKAPKIKQCKPTYESVRRSYHKSGKTPSRLKLNSSKSRKT